MRYDYDGRRFRPAGDHAGKAGDATPIARYHQDGDLVWAEFTGGHVRRGGLTGTCGPDGELELAYTMVLAGGDVVAGHCHSRPELLPDGRIQLRERFRRFTPTPSAGESVIEEVPSGEAGGEAVEPVGEAREEER